MNWLVSCIWGSFLALTGVGLGAFGAHALRGILDQRSLESYQTGVLYQLVHALALIAVGLISQKLSGLWWTLAPCFLFFGTVAFSGSIYLLVLKRWTFLGPVTPIGGVLIMLGWCCVLIGSTLAYFQTNT